MDRTGDFASLLEELVAASLPEEPRPAHAAPAVDFLAAVEEVPAGRPLASPSEAVASYRDIALEEEFAALLDQRHAEVLGELLPLTPEAIAAELGLGATRLADLPKLRRSFALRNHPDCVAPHMRDRALARMQIANALIDDAERRTARS